MISNSAQNGTFSDIHETSLRLQPSAEFCRQCDCLLLAIYTALVSSLRKHQEVANRFFVSCGTLLGLTRESFHILPWEDDIDITLLLETKAAVAHFGRSIFPQMVADMREHRVMMLRQSRQFAKCMVLAKANSVAAAMFYEQVGECRSFFEEKDLR